MEVRGVLEARVLRQEDELHGPDRTVALLADYDFGDLFFVRRHVLLVDLLPVEKQDEVGVLFERSAIVTDDPIREPILGFGNRQIKDVFITVLFDRDNSVPEEIARCACI